ncbi:antibiotic biosynthesis monooxygenase [Ursidibacter sp. B-7004-1]
MKKLLTALLFSTAITAQATPIFNIFELGIQAGQEALYDDVGTYNITTSLKNEAGTLAMYSVKRSDMPQMAYMFEMYADESAYQTHIQSEQYRYFLSRSPDILTQHKRKISVEPYFLADKTIGQTKDTINRFVILDIKPEYHQAFAQSLVKVMKSAIDNEDGVLAIYALKDKTDSNRWYLYEIYTNEQAYQALRQTAYFQKYLTQTAQMIEQRQAVAIVSSLLMNKGNMRFIAE